MSILLSDVNLMQVMWCLAQTISETELAELQQIDRFRIIAKAAAIHAVQYLEETCGCIADRVSEGGWPYKHPIEHRYECTTHMAEIHKELGI
jgi:hypothetical protein